MWRTLSAKQFSKLNLGRTTLLYATGVQLARRGPAILYVGHGVTARNYAQPPGGGFPAFNMMQQHQKGEALKEFVRKVVAIVFLTALTSTV